MFATDLNDALLNKARHGLYAKSLVQDVSPERLRRFFVEEDGGYRVIKSLREMVVFARQNLISDPPFSRMDLISLPEPADLSRAELAEEDDAHVPLRAQAGGYSCFWARRNPIGGFTDLFEPVDKKAENFLQKAAPTPAFHLRFEQRARPGAHRGTWTLRVAAGDKAGRPEAFAPNSTAQREADRVTVNQFAPPGVLINADVANPAIPRADRRVSRATDRQGEFRPAEDGAGRSAAAAARGDQPREEGK